MNDVRLMGTTETGESVPVLVSPQGEVVIDPQTFTAQAPLAIGGTDIAPELSIREATESQRGTMSAADKAKLNNLSPDAKPNVQSDWNVTDTASDAYIKNKPSIPAPAADATISTKGIVQLADAAAVTAGSATRATTAQQLKQTNDGLSVAQSDISALKASADVSKWAVLKWDGTALTILRSRGVQSVERLYSGVYRITWTQAFTSADYCMTAACHQGSTVDQMTRMYAPVIREQTVSSVVVCWTEPTSGTNTDPKRTDPSKTYITARDLA